MAYEDKGIQCKLNDLRQSFNDHENMTVDPPSRMTKSFKQKSNLEAADEMKIAILKMQARLSAIEARLDSRDKEQGTSMLAARRRSRKKGHISPLVRLSDDNENR